MQHRFISIVKDPGRIWTDYQVIDTHRLICMATCTQERDADAIAKILNLHWEEREALQIPETTS